MFSGIFNQRRNIHLVCMLRFPACACVCVCLGVTIISNGDAYWTVKFKVAPSFLISSLWWVLVCIQTYDSPGGLIGKACSPQRCQVPDSEQMLTNRNTNTPEGPRVCVCACMCVRVCVLHMCVFSSLFLVDGWGWQVLNCAEVERAAMGISRFMMLVRKLTNQSCFLFCSYSVNGAPPCPSCNHPSRPTNCTDSVLGSLPFSLPFSPGLSLGVYISLTLSLLWSLLSCQRVDIHFMPDRWNLYFITATYGERYFLPKGKLACNYDVLAAPNILYKHVRHPVFDSHEFLIFYMAPRCCATALGVSRYVPSWMI